MNEQPMNPPAQNIFSNLRQLVTYPPMLAMLLAVLLFILGGIIQPGFTRFEQAMNILRLAAFLAIIAAGQTLVIISGGEGIDLSIGAMVTLGAILSYGIVNKSDERILPGLLVTLAGGLFIGLINGVGIAYLRIPPLVMTLGMTSVVRGLVYAVTKGELTGGASPLMSAIVVKPLVLGIPGLLFISAIVALLMWILLERITYGKHLFAIGVNRVTARLNGVRVSWTIVATYMLCSMLAAFGGFLFLGYYEHVFLNLGEKYTLPAVAAVVMGGTTLAGGSGSYWGTIAGAIVLVLIESLLTTLQMQDYARQIVYGLVLLVLLAAYGRQKGLRQ